MQYVLIPKRGSTVHYVHERAFKARFYGKIPEQNFKSFGVKPITSKPNLT